MTTDNVLTDQWLERNKQRLSPLSRTLSYRDCGPDTLFGLGFIHEFSEQDKYLDGSPVLDKYGEPVVRRRRNGMPHLTDGEQRLYSTAADLKVAAKKLPPGGLSSIFARSQSYPVTTDVSVSDADMRDMNYCNSEKFNQLRARCLRERKTILPELENDLADYIEPAISRLMSDANKAGEAFEQLKRHQAPQMFKTVEEAKSRIPVWM